ncbi:P27 family phage terminase small subunit [Clostridium sp. YIM B02551]|uniref:P27 family phage terminase small subunit n=1 Tax=Clostridium sp. YIM B02551 TaxID=2910679 RepID=UPI001EEC0D82|nr:P27 family phage terminase small subunit [Clostridium sp. YIM B02551]
MGRNAKPIEILVADGKKHLTKAEIEERKKNEIKVGEKKLICPSYVKNDVLAYKKWKEIIKIYKDIDFVSSGDVGLLARYCMTHSEYLNLCDTRNKLNSVNCDWSKYEGQFPEDFQEALQTLLSINTDLQLENAINKKMDMLIKMEDRLFLNPLAKIKNVPKQQIKDEQPKSKWSNWSGRSG